VNHDEAAEADLNKSHQEQMHMASVHGKQERELAASLAGVDFKFADPEKGFDRSRVKGTVGMNLRVPNAAHSTALEALAGGRLHQVIVDDEKTGMLLLTKGQLQRRVTLIPLSKIRPNALTAQQVASAKQLVGANKAFLAFELLEFDNPEVEPAMKHIFGSTIVCTDKDAARAVCEKLGVKTVTLEGDLYDPSGTLAGGFRPKATNSSMIQRLGELGAVRRLLATVEAEVNSLAARIEAGRKQSEAFAQVQSSLEVKQHQLNLHAEAMRSSPVGQLAAALDASKQQLAEAEAAATAAKDALAEVTARKKNLEKQVKDFEGNREERMAQAKKAIAEATKEARKFEKAQQTAQAAEQKASLAVAELAKELAVANEQRAEYAKRAEQQLAAIEAKAVAEQKKRDEYEAAAAALQECQDALGSYDVEATAISARREDLEKERENGQIELNKIEHRCARYEKDLAAAEAVCRELLKRHPWMESEQHRFGETGTEWDFSKRKPAAMQKEFDKKSAALDALSKRINKSVLTMLETAEQEYSDLRSKKEIVENDKDKLEAVIKELDQKKIETLQKTWAKVNGDFGSIYSTLLPGARAKLEAQEGCPVEEGLIVKVGFADEKSGRVQWKASLQELSGGQRSLIALSLVLSLLRFKPAPVYILDEVDAALDLSHTQNIGKMIKAHFKQSQFLVVSLKEGMFNNANVIFRTKFVDSVSCVTRTVPNAAAAAAAAAGKGKGAGSAAASKAPLAVRN
jgi:structural maintenance of chromosome 2